MEYLTTLQNKLSTKEIDLIKYGAFEYDSLVEDLKEAMTNNQFEDHYIFSSPPGYSKTMTSNEIAEQLGIIPLKFDGTFGVFALAADLATALRQAPKDDSKILCFLDDCDSLFEKKNLNITKGMFDGKRKVLGYNMSMPPAYFQLDDEQREAIDSFKEVGRSGFRIPMDRFVFIVLTNKHLPTSQEMNDASPSKKEEFTDLHAIRRRNEYKELVFDKGVDWGYCAYVVMTKPVCEWTYPEITFEQKLEILRFTSRHWDEINLQNLSVFDKMTKKMVRYPNDYYDRWVSDYTNKKR
jgi:hypothetical protein